MKILITGNRGFIASHLHKHLKKQGYDVRGIDNLSHPCLQKVPSHYADVRYYSNLVKFIKWADFVFHLAAQGNVDKSIIEPHESIDVNVIGTANILDLVTKFNKKMIFASSSEVYGSAIDHEQMTEDHPLNPCSPYGASKAAADRLCKAYHTTYGTQVIIQRNFNIFGEFQNSNIYGAVISIFTDRALTNQPLYIFGDGNQERDYMHIKDAVRGYQLCFANSDKLWGEEINFGSGTTVNIKKIAELIIKITGSNSEIIHTKARPGEVKRLYAGIEKSKQFGFVPDTNFERDLTKYINWYKNFIFKK